MFHDQKEYLKLSHICSDFICLTAFYYLITPLFLSEGNACFSLPISVTSHPVMTFCLCRTDQFFILSPFFILLPILAMIKVKGYKKAALPGIKNLFYPALMLTTLSSAILSLLFFYFDLPLKENTFFSIISFCLLFLILGLNRLQLYYCLCKGNSNPNVIRHLLLVGKGFQARTLASHIENNPQCGWRVTGFMTDQTEDIGKSVANKKILGTIDQLPHIVHGHYTDCVVFTGDDGYAPHHDFLLRSCAGMGIDFATTQEIPMPMPMTTKKIWIFSEHMGNMEFKLIKFVYLRPLVVFFKRMVDLIASSVLIALCLPFWITISISIKLTSPGSVFFRQERIGKYGKKFILFKFRSMVGGAEKMQEGLMHLNEMDGPAFKIKKDPRQTITGKFLRKTSLDELPQLFNVFRGDISLVGPRPAIEKEVTQYRPIERRRLSVSQGITCIWQISGRNNIKFDEWMKLDLMYIDNLSTAQDIRILLKTIPAVLLKKGAY